MVDELIVKNILKIYEDAWVNQDVDKVLSIFTEDGVYHENAFEEPFVGHERISKYWQSKVVEEQSNIQFKLLNYWISDNVVIAEWDASFDSNIKKARIHIREIAIMEFEGEKIKNFREFWHVEKKFIGIR